MKMDGNIRVRIEKDYDQVYNSITKGIDIDSHVLFFICFCLAVAKQLKPRPIKARVDKFWSRTFDSQEWTAMYAVILEMNDVNLRAIENDEDVIRQVEAFANAGMDDFLEQLPPDYIRKNNGVLSIAVDDKAETVKDLLYIILDNYVSQEEK